MKATTKVLLGSILGGVLGFLYYYFIGCRSGSCPITSNPYISILFGVVAGIILAYPDKKRQKND
jgi:hypothetical protein